jgi:hypothetical protein
VTLDQLLHPLNSTALPVTPQDFVHHHSYSARHTAMHTVCKGAG